MVPVYDVFGASAQVVIVQRYMPGGDLAALIKPGPLPPERAARLLATVAEAMAFAHRKGFIHRDLKPGNVLLDEQGQPLVADFGLALHESVQRLHRGDRSGTRPYRSPEQVRGEAHRMDGRCDIWSLGVILYELLSGRRPFAAPDAHELDDEILYRDPWPLRMRDPGIPAELDRICQKCLAKRVSERYSSASELAEDLQHWLRGGSSPSLPAADGQHCSPGTALFRSGGRGIVLGTAAGAPGPHRAAGDHSLLENPARTDRRGSHLCRRDDLRAQRLRQVVPRQGGPVASVGGQRDSRLRRGDGG